jgi:pimeloyl-ACP methyl ester carboxylesterase
VLGLEFVLLARVGRPGRGVPSPTRAQLARAWLSETIHLYRTFCWRQPFRWRAEPDVLPVDGAGRTGVVLVHGFMCNRGFWGPWLRRLRAEGHPAVAVNLEPVSGPIESYVQAVDHAVALLTQRTGRPPLLVCHSMGGLAARAWWRQTHAQRSVAGLVTIGSPHGGTWMGRFSRRPNGRQMRLDGQWVHALALAEQKVPLPPTTCWYSNCDNIVFPAETATLPAARNRFVPGEAHVALAFHPDVIEDCLGLLRRAETAGQGESITRSAAENV